MERAKRSLLHRGAVGASVSALFISAMYIAWEFIAVFVLAVFLYYAVRPIHDALSVLNLPVRVRAGLAILMFGLPFVLLTVYALTIIAIEIQSVFSSYESQEALLNDILLQDNFEGFDKEELQAILLEIQNETQLTEGLLSVTGVLTRISSVFVQLLVLLVLTYSMLVDGPRLKSWVVETLDHGGVLKQFAQTVDKELSATLFGNIVNVFVTGVTAVVVFTGFNFYAPEALQIPAPGLLGALAGVGSLIPVFGIKLVYVPLTGGLAVTAWMDGVTGFIGPLLMLLVVSAVFIDFIPDMFIRALVSGEKTHTGVLITAYIIGPSVLGFYGLFLAPILLVLLICAGDILVPYVLHGEKPPERQTELSDYTDDQSNQSPSSGWINTPQKVWQHCEEALNTVGRIR